MTSAQIIGDELLVHDSAGPRLIGSRCRACGAVTFPQQDSCRRCTGDDVAEHRLARTGTLWGFTIQGFPPKEPYMASADLPFRPYGVGYVELDGEVLVESRLVADDWRALTVGMPMELVVVPFHENDDGTPVMTYAFAPAEEKS